VVLRVDWNIPNKGGKITDPTRVSETLATLRHIREAGASSIVLLSHLGRPTGAPDPKYSFKPLLTQFEEIVGSKLKFVEDVTSEAGLQAIKAAKPGDIFLGENIRFHKEEERKGATPEQIKAFD
jgi:phosphoglycerate kinase